MSDQIDEIMQDIMAFCITDTPGSPKFNKKIREAQKRRDDLTQKQAHEKNDFGYSIQNPIFTSCVRSSDEYLQRLRTADGLKLTWERLGSTVLEKIYGYSDIPIDEYQLFLQGDKYRKIYICPYGHDGDYIPRGMILAKANNQDKTSDETPSVPEKKDTEENKNEKKTPQKEKMHIDSAFGPKVVWVDSTDHQSVSEKEIPYENDDQSSSGILLIECVNCGARIRKESKYCRLCGKENILANVDIDLTQKKKDKKAEHNEQERQMLPVKKSRSWKPILAILILLLIGGGLIWYATKPTSDDSAKSAGNKTPVITAKPTVLPKDNSDLLNGNINRTGQFEIGKTVKFGSYKQNLNIGNNKDAIEWIIIGQDGNGVNLISKKIIDIHPYQANLADVPWAKSDLRKWLNEEFFNTAFSADEKIQIRKWEYSDADGSVLRDYIYCLTPDEAKMIWRDENKRTAEVTGYVFSHPDYTLGKVYGQWWLRSEIKKSGEFYSTAYVSQTGSIESEKLDSKTIGIRPCLYVSKKAIEKATQKSSASKDKPEVTDEPKTNQDKQSTDTKEEVFDPAKSGSQNVYADIISIQPAYSISSSRGQGIGGVVCECKTGAGKTIWVYCALNDYKKYIDSSISDISKADYQPKKVSFSPAARVHGFVKSANSIVDTLSVSIQSSNVLYFLSIDK